MTNKTKQIRIFPAFLSFFPDGGADLLQKLIEWHAVLGMAELVRMAAKKGTVKE